MLSPTVIAVPIFALMIAIEAVYAWRKKSDEYHDNRDTWTNIFLGFGSLLWGAVFGLGIAWIYGLCYEIAPFKFPTNVWWTWVALFTLDDLAYYVFHRVSHESRLFWNFHVVHHSSEHYNLSVAVRQSWFSGILHWIFYVPLVLIGFAPWMFVIVHGLNITYQFWIHTRFIHRLGPLEWILNTPSHHRVHHGVNNPYLDKNYAGVLIIWDRVFRSFVSESETPTYGIIKPLRSYNVLWINTHGWVEMRNAVKRQPTVMKKLACVFASPNMDLEKQI